MASPTGGRAGGRGSDAAPRVLRAGDHDAFVIKPAGMSVELLGANADDTLLAWVRRTLGVRDAWLPHRIDRVARGIVVVALTREAAAFHSRMIAERRWRKHYLARVAWAARTHTAAPSAPPAWQTLLGRHVVHLRQRGRRAEVVRSGGKRSVLEVLACAPDPRRLDQAHLLVALETGRFHQIRATMAHLGAPIAHDDLYDPRVERRGAPYLEHALLWLPRFPGSGGVETAPSLELAFDPDDPQRETIAAPLREALLTLAASPPASP